jgi:hypothetical protein
MSFSRPDERRHGRMSFVTQFSILALSFLILEKLPCRIGSPAW